MKRLKGRSIWWLEDGTPLAECDHTYIPDSIPPWQLFLLEIVDLIHSTMYEFPLQGYYIYIIIHGPGQPPLYFSSYISETFAIYH